MSDIESIVSIPDPGRTMEGLRDTGYNFETAVADLVDNSIAAEATKVDIQVARDFRGNIRLLISDNGIGMDKKGLVQAMQYGSPRRPDPASLGKFGLGLKTASTAFCRRLSLISRPSGGAVALMATWDLDHVIDNRQWLLQMTEEVDSEGLEKLDDVAPGSSGTVVLWDKVDRLLKNYQDPTGAPARKALDKRCGELREHLAMIYQRFLDVNDKRARDVEIRLNGKPVLAWDPFQKGLSELVAEDSPRVEGSGAGFQVRAYILPRREEFPDDEQAKAAKLSSGMQGLYIYREERLIHAADWLGMYQKEPHGTLLRVEFSFDHKLDDAFHLDIKKSQIILNEDLWGWLKDQFLTAPRREADRRYRQGKKKEISKRSKDAHDASNNSIRNKEAEIGGARVNVTNPDTGEVTVTNGQGTFKTILKISSASKPGEVYVQPAEDVADGLLFEPAMIEQHKAVRINTQHPYYHKVYVPNLNSSVTIQGMDSLIWAICSAELSATTDKTAEAFRDMRYEVTRILRKLVEGLPEPDTDDNSDAP
ncbi:ATP-binding protein [Marinobacter subterrani]|uniref:Histidine kinase-, DNA gyrase B-, and HSP90-like ATPase n=1 Tax=Marinobacter subterrani TaxID=1658765 RepID=A0A0J7JE23_9GAMM|nr:ATP-binding protein [Marinobacter subterrani]KMQ76387.1 Histidine kinase-, DNA gyrase B-, and HSP90-like ATPase [Marinobacter subterrani]